MTDLRDAIEYLGAAELGKGSDPDPAFDRFAAHTPSGRWYTFSRATLARFASGALTDERRRATIGQAAVLMPTWWTPQTQVAEKGWVPYEPGPKYFPLMNAIIHGCAGTSVSVVTADTESGEELPLDAHDRSVAVARAQALRAAPTPRSNSPSL